MKLSPMAPPGYLPTSCSARTQAALAGDKHKQPHTKKLELKDAKGGACNAGHRLQHCSSFLGSHSVTESPTLNVS